MNFPPFERIENLANYLAAAYAPDVQGSLEVCDVLHRAQLLERSEAETLEVIDEAERKGEELTEEYKTAAHVVWSFVNYSNAIGRRCEFWAFVEYWETVKKWRSLEHGRQL